MATLSAIIKTVSTMKLELTLALKYIGGRKKSSILLFLCMTTISIVISSASVILSSSQNANIIKYKELYGDWHLCYLVSDTSAAEPQITKTGLADAVGMGYRLQQTDIKDDTCAMDLSLVDHPGILAPNLSTGRLPVYSHEIIVEDWYLRKCGISKLPATIVSGGVTYTITGAFPTRPFSYMVLRAFGDLSANGDLIQSKPLNQFPVDNNYIMQQSNNPAEKKPEFVFVRLKPGVHIDTAVKTLAGLKSIKPFKGGDQLSVLTKNNTPLYNVNLINEEKIDGAEQFAGYSSSSSKKLTALAIQAIFILALSVLIYIFVVITMRANIADLGILGAIGMETGKLRMITALQMLMISAVSLPAGSLIGIAGCGCIFSHTAGSLNGALVIPYAQIAALTCLSVVIVGVCSYVSTFHLARLSPVEAMQKKSGAGTSSTPYFFSPGLGAIPGQIGFSITLGLKTSAVQIQRTLGFVLAIAILLAAFIGMTRNIEVSWKTGNGRQSYTPDYIVDIPYVGYDSNIIPYISKVTPPDNSFYKSLEAIQGVETVYRQEGIVDKDSLRGGDIPTSLTLYNYMIKINKSLLSKQGYQLFSKTGRLDANGYPSDAFISSSLSGYGDSELAYAKKHLIAGKIDIDAMKNNPIVLLPKYIMPIQNMDVPYSTLKVGDKITLVETSPAMSMADGDIGIKKTWGTFTIGGFLDTLPFQQLNGDSYGLVAILSNQQLKKVDGDVKGVMQIYVSEKKNADILPGLSELCKKYGYTVEDAKHSFPVSESTRRSKNNQMITYVIFGVLGFAVFLCMSEIFLSEVLLRKPEYALLSAVGMKKNQIVFSMITESLLFSVLGIALGIILGFFYVANTGSQTVGDQVLTLPQTVPWAHILVSSFLVLALSVLFSLAGALSCLKDVSVRDIGGVE